MLPHCYNKKILPYQSVITTLPAKGHAECMMASIDDGIYQLITVGEVWDFPFPREFLNGIASQFFIFERADKWPRSLGR